MVITIDVKVNGDLERLRGASLVRPFSRIGAYFVREWAIMFETAGASRESKWPELAPSTLIAKVKAGRSTDILQRTGLLRASGRVLLITPTTMIFGTTESKAVFHDSDEPRTRLPQRKLVRVLPRDVDIIEREVAAHLQSIADGGPTS